MTTLRIEPNHYVTLDYTLRDDEGTILDASDAEDGELIEYVHGYGMLVPGLEAGLTGLASGEEKTIVVSAAEGFGEHDEELLLEVDRSEFPDPKKVNVGEEFVAQSPDGDEMVMRVVEVNKDGVIVDANHPLAGVRLTYSVIVRSIRVATEEEIEEAAARFEEAEHEHSDDCGHDHDHDHGDGQLVTLRPKNGGKKPNLAN